MKGASHQHSRLLPAAPRAVRGRGHGGCLKADCAGFREFSWPFAGKVAAARPVAPGVAPLPDTPARLRPASLCPASLRIDCIASLPHHARTSTAASSPGDCQPHPSPCGKLRPSSARPRAEDHPSHRHPELPGFLDQPRSPHASATLQKFVLALSIRFVAQWWHTAPIPCLGGNRLTALDTAGGISNPSPAM